jgi:hypothetical protein
MFAPAVDAASGSSLKIGSDGAAVRPPRRLRIDPLGSEVSVDVLVEATITRTCVP